MKKKRLGAIDAVDQVCNNGPQRQTKQQGENMSNTIENLNALPDECIVEHPEDGRPVKIIKGENGYREVNATITRKEISEFNLKHNANEAKMEAMLCGSMFGWHVPGANPKEYEK